jgi:uncharacterized membrane protein
MISFLFLSIFFGGCLDTESDTGDSLCSHDPPLSYSNFGKGFIDIHCMGCHSADVPEGHRVGAPVGVDFNTYDLVMDWSERLEARATRTFSDTITMPPGGGPTSSELDLFEEWLYCVVMPQKEIRDSQ